MWEEEVQELRQSIYDKENEIVTAHYTHHAFYIIPDAIDGGTLRGVAIAKAVSTYDKLIYGVVVFFFDFSSGV